MYLLARTVLWEFAMLHLGKVNNMRYLDLNTGSASSPSLYTYKQKHTYKRTHKSIIFVEPYCVSDRLYVKLKITTKIIGISHI